MAQATQDHLLMVHFSAFNGLAVVQAARARGLRVTALGPAKAFEQAPEVAAAADRQIVADLHDPQAALGAVAQAHRAEPLTCLFVAREDLVHTAAVIAAGIGLPWNSLAAVATMRDKWRTREALAGAGLRQPEHWLCQDAPDVQACLRRRPGGLVLKPLASTGSLGVSRVQRAADIAPAVARVRATQPGGAFLAEQWIGPAQEYSVEGVWLGDRPHVLAITAKQTTGAPHFIELGHTLPVPLGAALEGEVCATVRRGLRALGASHGLFHAEVFVDQAGVVFGEAHPRAGGDRIAELLLLAGFDLYGLMLDGALRPDTPAPPPAARAAAVRYFRFPPGRLLALEGVDALAGAPGVRYLRLDVAVGARIAPVTSSFDRHGCFVLAGESYAATLAEAERLRALVRPQVAREEAGEQAGEARAWS